MPENVPPRQLAFDLPLDPRYGREDFLVGPANEAAYALIEAWPNWPDSVLVLTGPSGSGKSHLAAIWAERAHAWTVQAGDINADAVQHLVSNGALVIEDIDRAQDRDEAALFHLLNRARERGCPLLLTSGTGIDALNLATPDLRSRLRLAPGIAIREPDDALLRAVLVKLFVDRQLVVDLSVIDSLALRIDRSLGRARDVVAELDRDALGRQRRISRPLALAVLRRMGFDDESDPDG
ncbi:DnaA/Hda family protein [Methylobacterium sp. J-088]|uniref:DnaA ATPase domain-containing protein n=1 Tax=unclassified Methylobacterium TaxID=2615210 RepID=UPI001FBAE1DB|nr:MULTISPECIES: DnaA/Hda family protein [unclassified Methylobacterium]MCJ2062435.1 DnaA/Hda family protein [Methylobacterium sp. J-088]